LPRRAPWLERDLRQGDSFAEPVCERCEVGRHAVDGWKELTFDEAAVGSEALPGRQRRNEPVARSMAEREPARGGGGVVMSYSRRCQRERERQRIGGGLFVELEEPRGGGGDAEGCREVGRPDAAIKNRRAIDRAPQPGHRLDAGKDRAHDVVSRRRRHRLRQGERAGNDDGARRDHGSKVDVVDLAQSRERATGREIERGVVTGLSARAHGGAKLQQGQTFGGPRARGPGADGVDEMHLDGLANALATSLAARDRAGEPFERAHRPASGDDQSTSLPRS
jgi:hypothetical protein